MVHQFIDEGRRVDEESTCFIGSILNGPGHGLIVLRGEFGTAAVDRLGCHIDAFFDGPTRFLMLDARAVECYHPDLLDLLGYTQRRLADRRGMLQVRGLAAARLADPTSEPPDAAVPAPDTAALVDTGTTAPCGDDGPGRHRSEVPAEHGRHRAPGPHGVPTAGATTATTANEVDRAPA